MDDFSKRIANLPPEKLALLELRLQKRAGVRVLPPTISHRGESNLVPLSFAQQRLWFYDQLEPGSFVYNLPAAVRLAGRLDIPALARTLSEIIRRHEILRTTFPTVDGIPLQRIAPPHDFALPVTDLSHFAADERAAEVNRLIAREAQRPFDLARGPLFRALLMKLCEEEHVALLTHHHIIYDGWSAGVFVKELVTLYEAFLAGRPSPLPELPIQYADFAVWQREWLQGEALEEQLSFWRRNLSGKLPVMDLSAGRPRPAIQTFHGARYLGAIEKSLTESLNELSRKEGSTLFMTLLAAFKTLLYLYSGQPDIIVGSGVANRNRANIEPLIGFFVNALALRTNLTGNPSFRELLRRVREVTLNAYTHQDLPFEKLVEAIQPARDPSRTPIFQVVFDLQNTPMPSLELPELQPELIDLDHGVARYDLTLLIWETDQELRASWVYNSDLFDAATIARMSRHLESLLGTIVAQPGARLNELEFLIEDEKKGRTMRNKRREESKPPNFKQVKPTAVKLRGTRLIKTGALQPGDPLPLVIEPTVDDFDLVDWATREREFIEENLSKHGAILFRGFDVKSASDFERFALAVCSELFEENGELNRDKVSGRIYTPVSYPNDKPILWHNENTFCERWPMKIWFCCDTPAQQGGETPIADSRKVYRLIDPKIRERFAEKKIMYMRNYGEGLGLDWQTVFQTTSVEEAEASFRRAGILYEWKNNYQRLRTRAVRRAVERHPKTGEMVWFNQATHWHPLCLDPKVREALMTLFKEEELPRNCYYGDGAPIEDSVMNEICEVFRQTEVVFPWRKGDILMLDNMLTAHARNPYVGPRKIYVALGELITVEDLP